jgi:hypothetical protein
MEGRLMGISSQLTPEGFVLTAHRFAQVWSLISTTTNTRAQFCLGRIAQRSQPETQAQILFECPDPASLSLGTRGCAPVSPNLIAGGMIPCGYAILMESAY